MEDAVPVCKSSAVLPLLWRRRFLPRCLQLPHRNPHRAECRGNIAVQNMQEIQLGVGYFLESCWFFLKESLLSEALDAVIKHLWESFETWKPEFPDLGSVHAVWIAVTFLVIAPVGSNSMSVILTLEASPDN